MSMVKAAKWTARVLTCVIVLFSFFWSHISSVMMVKHLGPLNWNDYIILTTMVVSLVGLLLAWKWERMGAGIALIAIVICAVVNWKVLIFPGTLSPATALFYLVSWWMRTHEMAGKHNYEQC